MAEALMDKVMHIGGFDSYEIVETHPGSFYENMLASHPFLPKTSRLVLADYVTMDSGTGCVHTAPGFGADDYVTCKRYDMDMVVPVDDQGRHTDYAGKYAGMTTEESNPVILADMKEAGSLFASEDIVHSYPHCWRCDTPLIYYARESWFIKMTAVKEDLIANNNTINWIPENIGKGRFGDWLENVQDWGISRNRYWGTPLNIWQCECGHMHSIGSIAELKEMSDNCPDDIELHRPYIDDVTITCPECGKQMHRVPEVIDCWFDSGSMPFAQHHYCLLYTSPSPRDCS